MSFIVLMINFLHTELFDIKHCLLYSSDDSLEPIQVACLLRLFHNHQNIFHINYFLHCLDLSEFADSRNYSLEAAIATFMLVIYCCCWQLYMCGVRRNKRSDKQTSSVKAENTKSKTFGTSNNTDETQIAEPSTIQQTEFRRLDDESDIFFNEDIDNNNISFFEDPSFVLFKATEMRSIKEGVKTTESKLSNDYNSNRKTSLSMAPLTKNFENCSSSDVKALVAPAKDSIPIETVRIQNKVPKNEEINQSSNAINTNKISILDLSVHNRTSSICSDAVKIKKGRWNEQNPENKQLLEVISKNNNTFAASDLITSVDTISETEEIHDSSKAVCAVASTFNDSSKTDSQLRSKVGKLPAFAKDEEEIHRDDVRTDKSTALYQAGEDIDTKPTRAARLLDTQADSEQKSNASALIALYEQEMKNNVQNLLENPTISSLYAKPDQETEIDSMACIERLSREWVKAKEITGTVEQRKTRNVEGVVIITKIIKHSSGKDLVFAEGIRNKVQQKWGVCKRSWKERHQHFENVLRRKQFAKFKAIDYAANIPKEYCHDKFVERVLLDQIEKEDKNLNEMQRKKQLDVKPKVKHVNGVKTFKGLKNNFQQSATETNEKPALMPDAFGDAAKVRSSGISLPLLVSNKEDVELQRDSDSSDTGTIKESDVASLHSINEDEILMKCKNKAVDVEINKITTDAVLPPNKNLSSNSDEVVDELADASSSLHLESGNSVKSVLCISSTSINLDCNIQDDSHLNRKSKATVRSDNSVGYKTSVKDIDDFVTKALAKSKCDSSKESSLESIIGLQVCDNFGFDDILTAPLRPTCNVNGILKKSCRNKASSEPNHHEQKNETRRVTFLQQTVINLFYANMPTVMEQIAISETAALHGDKSTTSKYRPPKPLVRKKKHTRVQQLPHSQVSLEKMKYFNNVSPEAWKRFPHSDELLNYEKTVLGISEEELQKMSILTEEEEREFLIESAKPFDDSEILDLSTGVPRLVPDPSKKIHSIMPTLSSKTEQELNKFPNTKFAEFMKKMQKSEKF